MQGVKETGFESVEKVFSYPFYWPIFLQKYERSRDFFNTLWGFESGGHFSLGTRDQGWQSDHPLGFRRTSQVMV